MFYLNTLDRNVKSSVPVPPSLSGAAAGIKKKSFWEKLLVGRLWGQSPAVSRPPEPNTYSYGNGRQ